jgi:hypothetical protein
VADICKQQGREFPKHLVIQSDNTVAQAKNSHVTLLLSYVVARFKFISVTLNFLMVGHTHEDLGLIYANIPSP